MDINCIIILSVLSITSCSLQHKTSEITSKLLQYDHLVSQGNSDSLSEMYAFDGDHGDQAHGRVAIKIFLDSITKNVHVLTRESTTKTIQLIGDQALHHGTYHHHAVIDLKDTIHLNGEFTIQWQWTVTQGWLIKRIDTEL